MKLDQDDVIRICQRVGNQDVDTALVAEQFEITRRQVQQPIKEYRDSGEIPQQTPGRKSYGKYPTDLGQGILELHQRLSAGAVAIGQVLRVRDGFSIAINRIHTILQEYEHVNENPNKQGRRRLRIRFEREYAGVTIHMNWYHNDRGHWMLAFEDVPGGVVFDMIETDSNSASHSVDLPDSVSEGLDVSVPILKIITELGLESVNPRQNTQPSPNHKSEVFPDDNKIQHTLCKVWRPQSNEKIKRLFQTYDKRSWWFRTLVEFLSYYNKERPHVNLDWNNLETSTAAFDRLLPSPTDNFDDPPVTEMSTDE